MKQLFIVLVVCFGSFGLSYWIDTDSKSSEVEAFSKDPKASNKFKLPEGFNIRLVAGEPDVFDPMSMAVDDSGSIYISEASNYRYGGGNVPKNQKKEGRIVKDIKNPIKRLDIGPDGKLKGSSIIAEGFENPVIGLDVYKDKLYATNLNKLLVMDIGPDGEVLNRKVLVKDAAYPWNPFGMYRVKVGPDNKIWLAVADHPSSKSATLTGSDGRTVRLNGQSGGLVRCDLDGSNLEVIAEGLRAPYAFDIDPWGHVWIISNGEQSPNIFLNAIPGMDYGYHSRDVSYNWLAGNTPLAPPVREMEPGANTSALFYYSSMFPSEYWDNVFISNYGSHGYNPTNRLVKRFIRQDKNNTATDGLLKVDKPFLMPMKNDTMFRPTGIVTAHDGGLYLCDWHGRDDENNKFGRIYKITYGEEKQDDVYSSHSIAEMKPMELIALLDHPNEFIREQVRRALVQAGAKALKPLGKILEKGDALAAANAIWTLTRMNSIEAYRTMDLALKNSDPRVRAHGLRQLRQATGQKLEGGEPSNGMKKSSLISADRLQKLVKSMLYDPDGEVRMEAAIAMEVYSSPKAIGHAFQKALEVTNNQRLFYQIGFQLGLHGDKTSLDVLRDANNSKLNRVANIAAVTARYRNSALAKAVKDWKLPGTGEDKVENLVTQLKNGKKIQPVAEKLMILKWIEEHSPTNKLMIAFLSSSLQYNGYGERSMKLTALRAVRLSSIHASDIRKIILHIINDTDDEYVKMSALYALGSFSDAGHYEEWQAWMKSPSKDVTIAALRSLRQYKRKPQFVKALWPTARAVAQRDTLLSEEVWFTFQQLGIPKSQLIELPNSRKKSKNQNKSEQEVLSRLKNASALRGKLIFSSNTVPCASCHSVKPEGGKSKLGPTLAGIGAASQPKYLIESILEPNKIIKPGYQMETIKTKAGRTFSGRVETKDQQLIIRSFGSNSEAVKVPLSEVKHRTKSPVSLMPKGLGKNLSEAELADLTEYLRSLKGSR